MAIAAKMPARERPRRHRLKDVAGKLSGWLGWKELCFGAAAALLVGGLLVGLRIRELPSYKPGETAVAEVRAPRDITYEDAEAIANLREAARERTPAVYELAAERIARKEGEIRRAFAAGRRLLSEYQVTGTAGLDPARRAELLRRLEEEAGGIIPSRFLPVFLDFRFAPELENKILQVLDITLRGGVVADGELFRLDLKKGIVLRDRESQLERPLKEFPGVRDLPAAREYLRLLQVEFSGLPPPAREEIRAFLEGQLVPTVVFDASETQARRDAAAARVQPVQVQIKKGKVIVRAGEQVSARAAAELAMLRQAYGPGFIFGRLLGYSLLVAGLLYALWHYLVFYQKRHRKIRNHAVLVAVVLVLEVVLVGLLSAALDILSPRVSLRDASDLYAVLPFALAAMLVTLLIDTNVGWIASTAVGVLTGLFYEDIYLAVYALLGSLAGIYSIRQYKERSALFKSGLTVGIVNACTLAAVHPLEHDSFVFFELLAKAAFGVASGLLASALCSVFLPALESLFKITTDIRLLELSNLNSPVLRRLSVEAPGTYHHSLMVGTLSEAAAEAIGANPLLVRVAAYYHDLGKMLKPEYFLENQAFGVNKHESLSPSMSCLILSNHVKSGLELARQAGLNETICQMIPQHHGTRIMTFFYQKAKEGAAAEGREVREEDFRYPGPKPQSKEAAILMMADSVEAASRTLSNPSAAQIQGMIDRLIEDILADHQLDECDITLREVRLAKESFFKVLSGIFHRRIDYPGYDFRVVAGNADKTRVLDTNGQQAKAI